jgi:putative ABC transport system permease protein
MRIGDGLSMSASALLSNPARTLLTILGITIGIACVVSMAAIGAGARARVAAQIRAFGANVILVKPGETNREGVRTAAGTKYTLTAADAAAIAELPGVAAAAPSVFGTGQVVRGSRNWSTTINGTTEPHFRIREWPLKDGRMFSDEDQREAGKVAIIGSMVAEKLFDDENPIGQVVRVLSTPFTVIGVLKEKGTSGGQSQDDVLFVPLSTATLRLIGSANKVNREAVAYIVASADSEDAVAGALGDIEALLKERHRIRAGQDNDFVVTSAAQALAAQQESIRTISLLLGSIAAVSLVVGGISIMNIMLVAVSERRAEIGLKLAIGARPRDVRRQFLLEAVMLCTVAGVIGVVLGSGSAWAISSRFDWPVLIEPWAALLAIGLAGGVGVFFGFYPAKRAAALQPVVALRLV